MHRSAFQLEFSVPRPTQAEEDASNGPTGPTAWPADPRLRAVMNYYITSRGRVPLASSVSSANAART